MFATRSASAYAKVGIETRVTSADPHELIVILFDGALLAINSAAVSMASGDIPTKVRSISKAIEIITYGLKASLDSEAGGELSQRLAALYDYMTERLFFANANNNEAILSEVSGLLADLKDAWEHIGQGATAGNKE
ncbi:MAG TPA: flagellar export chaperone FliS [Rhodocyclaceae bacterium]|nr:flagellar export chaperone FliS [Rhodocyclaceae bacterium]